MKIRLFFVSIFLVTTVLLYGWIKIDIYFNPWLEQVIQNWHWHNYLTSFHFSTALYLKGNYWWVIVSFIVSLISTWQFAKARRAK